MWCFIFNNKYFQFKYFQFYVHYIICYNLYYYYITVLSPPTLCPFPFMVLECMKALVSTYYYIPGYYQTSDTLSPLVIPYMAWRGRLSFQCGTLQKPKITTSATLGLGKNCPHNYNVKERWEDYAVQVSFNLGLTNAQKMLLLIAFIFNI